MDPERSHNAAGASRQLGLARRSRFSWCAVLAVGCLLAAVSRVHGADEEARAGRMVTIRDGAGVTRVYVGDVEMTFGGLQVRADSARARTSENRVLFVGGVRLSDRDRAISADTLAYDRSAGAAAFIGSVVALAGDRTVSAGRLTYRPSAASLHASGRATLHDADRGVLLRADDLLFYADGDSGSASGNAAVVKSPESGLDTVRATADTVRFSDSGGLMTFRGAVRVSRSGVNAVADSARYDATASELDMAGGLRAAWPGQSDSDSVRASARRMRTVGGSHGCLSLQLAGHVKLDLGRHASAGDGSRRGAGDSVAASLESGKLSRLLIHGDGRVDLVNGSGAATAMTADTIRIGFSDGSPDSIGMLGSAVVRHVESDRTSESRIVGDTIDVLLSASEVRHLDARGRAECEHAGSDDGRSAAALTGDRILATFEGGRLRRTRAEGGVRGRYGKREVTTE